MTLPEGFIPWDGGECPVAGNALVQPFYRGPADPAKGIMRAYGRAREFAWYHDGAEDDIIAYRAEP